MLVERKFSDIFVDKNIEETFEHREDSKEDIDDDIKRSIIEENINLQISVAYSISTEKDIKQRSIIAEDKSLLEDTTFSLELVKSISEDEQVNKYKKFFDSVLLISKSNGSVFQLIGRSRKAKAFFCELLKNGKIDRNVLKYVLGDESAELGKFKNSKNIKYNVPYEFLPDFKSTVDVSQNKFLSTIIDYKDNPLKGETTGFLTKLNVNYLEKDENMVALSDKVGKLFFIEYDLFGNCLVTWKKK